jgi:hypothetical protein
MNNDPEILYRKLVQNPKAPQHARISALRFLSNPSFALLRKLATDENSPGRLAALAAELFAAKAARKQIEKEHPDA